MTDTPRTDAAADFTAPEKLFLLCRTLERELAAAQAELAKLREPVGDAEVAGVLDCATTPVRIKNLIRRLWAEREQDRKDAARYRWLRDEAEPCVGAVMAHQRVCDGYHFCIRGEALDTAIDTAIAAQEAPDEQ